MLGIRNLFTPKEDANTRQIVSPYWQEREQILKEDVNLFCWKRPVDLSQFGFLQNLTISQPRSIEIRITEKDLINQIQNERMAWDAKVDEVSEAFWQDIIMLASDFLNFSSTKSGHLYLKVVNDNACTKFHTDGYSLRLFTTYIGRGTEWLPELAVDRAFLGTTNDRIIKDPNQIRRMTPFEVGILKGEPDHSQRHETGIVHRSPTIQKEGLKRVILRIDLD